MGRLTRIELCNFKSYKDVQVVELGDIPFTSIIGPNGSGKSNMMDAISFVLGVQTRHLRSSKLSELVYRGRLVSDGTGSQHDERNDPTSAYVQLTYEREDGRITTFKRVVRRTPGNAAGSSEYLVDGARQTEKEFQEILAAENILTKAKNFLVFQGDVEAISTMSPPQLARLIEQVSGSIDFKTQYEELEKINKQKEIDAHDAFQKRRACNADVKQCRDQHRDMVAYNQKLEKRETLKTTLLLWKLYHMEDDIKVKRELLQQCQQELADLEQTIDNDREFRDQANADYAKVSTQHQKVDRAVKRLERDIEAQRKNLMPIAEKIKIKSAHLKDSESARDTVGKQAARQERDVADIERQISVVSQAEAKFEAEAAEAASHTAGLRNVDATVLAEYAKLKAQYDATTSVEQSKIKTIARQKQTYADRLTLETAKVEEATVAQAKLRRNIEDLEAEKSSLSESINRENHALSTKKKDLADLAASHARRQEKVAQVEAKLQECVETLIEHRAQQRATEKERRHHEQTQTLKRLFPGVKGLVYDLCKPKERKYETAVATVLGRFFDAIIVDTSKTSQECINYIKDQRWGLVTILPLDNLVVERVQAKWRSLGSGIRLAYDTIDFPPSVEAAAQFVCRNALICDDLETAKHVRWVQKINTVTVTVDGSIISKSNLMSGGRAENRNASRWEESRLQSLQLLKEKLTGELDDLRKQNSEYNATEQALNSEVQSISRRVSDYREQLNAANISLKSRQSELAHNVSKEKDAAKPIAELEKKIAKLDGDIRETEAFITGTKHEVFGAFCAHVGVEDIRDFETAQSTYLEQVEEKRVKFREQKKRLSIQLGNDNSRLTASQKRIEGLNKMVQQHQTMIQNLRDEEAVVKQQIEELSETLAEEQQKAAKMTEKLKGAKAAVDSHGDRISNEQTKLNASLKRLTQLEEEVGKLLSVRTNLLRDCKIGELQVPLLAGSLDSIPLTNPEAEDEEGDLIIQDDEAAGADGLYGIEVDYSGLADRYKRQSENVEESIMEQVNDLTVEIEKTVVNGRAQEHLDDAEKRLEEAMEQLDLVNGEVKRSKKEFDGVRRKRTDAFDKAYTIISECIDTIYKELTTTAQHPNGGSANMFWDGVPHDYNKGIIYNVQPPMKQVCTIDNLSGGEKTMAAVALLFAIHSFQPSPFFILDEIDAALDTVNVRSIGRFIKSQTNKNVQFIVISLKNGLYGKSDGLVGIYRDQSVNSSRSLSLDLRGYEDAPKSLEV